MLILSRSTNSAGQSDRLRPQQHFLQRSPHENSSKPKACSEGDLCDTWGYGSNGDGNGEHVNTPLEGYKFDSEVVVDAQVVIMEGCQRFNSRSNMILCKEMIPKPRF